MPFGVCCGSRKVGNCGIIELRSCKNYVVVTGGSGILSRLILQGVSANYQKKKLSPFRKGAER
jgi:hypothetical protein